MQQPESAQGGNMIGVNVVGVQFRRAGKIYDFNGKDFLINIGDRVVVETERGPSLAEVKRIGFSSEAERDISTLKPIIRVASRKDLNPSGRLSVDEASEFAKEKIKALKLEMRVISVEIQFGGNKVIVYFSAPGRVDFRELVKELAGGLKTRVELKQVGARDEAKLAGGLGICGREFCCSSFLREFVPVSIKMAKNQNLALNPSKVSGGCGRLLCCLTYEDETYKDLRQKLLPKGTRVAVGDDAFGDVIKGDILNQTMLIELDSGEQKSFPVNELKVVDQKSGVEDDWGDDIDLEGLMGDEEALRQLEDADDGSRSTGRDRQRQGDRKKRGRSGRGQQRDRSQSDRSKHSSSGSQQPASSRASKDDDAAGRPKKKSRRSRGKRPRRGDQRDGRPHAKTPKKDD